ncbi:hypothetical protein BT63DRAFT_427728 [Microthyrium microscopicum]|uniref:Uncharacterized protein n=1 Tax=Microthyrium microscopicum TaxID=703497 RepID=A0A6A6U0U5_9PEZI|nr:hypothetical protein BT63DRAFT_427728 [Microthyrium microscopicum]
MATPAAYHRYAKHGFAGLDGIQAKHIMRIMNSPWDADQEIAKQINALIKRFAIKKHMETYYRARGLSVPRNYVDKCDEPGSGRHSPVPSGPLDHDHSLILYEEPSWDERLATAKELAAQAQQAGHASDDIFHIFFYDGINVAQQWPPSIRLMHEPWMKKCVSEDLRIPVDEVTLESFLIWERTGCFTKPFSLGWLPLQKGEDFLSANKELIANTKRMNARRWKAKARKNGPRKKKQTRVTAVTVTVSIEESG